MKANQKMARADELERQLIQFDQTVLPLPGIRPPGNMIAFVWQMIDSIQRIEYIHAISNRRNRLSVDRGNPTSALFDPIQAAVRLKDQDFEEACWLVFLATHCGKNLKTGWLLSRELYGGLGQCSWTWNNVVSDPHGLKAWLLANRQLLNGKFGNHRKFESLNDGGHGTAHIIASYVDWVTSFGSHAQMFDHVHSIANGDRRKAFQILYGSMRQVLRFGRTGRFDYLTMIAKVGLADIDADSAYLFESTGPLTGAKLLFDGQKISHTSGRDLDVRLVKLDQFVNVGMQVLEDAICNWQKSPNMYQPFKG